MEKSRRLGWVSSCLKFAGRFGPREKKSIHNEFRVSAPTLSRDQATLFDSIPEDGGVCLKGGKLEVVDSSKLILPEGLQEPSLGDWLKVMLDEGRYVSMVGVERGEPSRETVRMIMKSIQDKKSLAVRYISRSSQDPAWRAVSPHSVVNVTGRYHARCYDHKNGRYADFVLNRILGSSFDISDMPKYNTGSGDKDWKEIVELRVSLVSGESSLIGKLDFGLDESMSRIIMIRKALAPYVLTERDPGFHDPIEIKFLEPDIVINPSR